MRRRDWIWLAAVVVLLVVAVWGVFFQKTVEFKEIQVPEEAPEVVVAEAEEPTPVPPTATSIPMIAPAPTPMLVLPTSTLVPPSSGLVPYEQEGGIPWSGAAWSADVAPDEIEVLTAGPANIAGVSLPGGVDRGSVIVFLPDPKKVVQYTVTGLVTGANWHGSYRPLTDPTTESTWRILANDRVAAMQEAPNCTSGLGCAIVDVLVVGPEGVVAQWVVQ